MEESMEKIKVLFIQEKKIKNKSNVITLGDLIKNEVPDTYEIDYVSVKEDVMSRMKKYNPQIVFIAQSKTFDILDLVRVIKETYPSMVILVNLATVADLEQEMVRRLKDLGVYKCYSSTLSVDSLVHDMFVSLNIE